MQQVSDFGTCFFIIMPTYPSIQKLREYQKQNGIKISLLGSRDELLHVLFGSNQGEWKLFILDEAGDFDEKNQLRGISIEPNPLEKVSIYISLIGILIFSSTPLIGYGFLEGLPLAILIIVVGFLLFLILRKIKREETKLSFPQWLINKGVIWELEDWNEVNL